MRYIPHTSKDVEEMLNTIGVSAVDNLFDVIPNAKRLKKPLNLPNSISEMELRNELVSLSEENRAQQYSSFLGAGCYAHYVPSVVNYLGSQGGFLTAYTPYQPEVSQGTLQTIFEFQTMISRLTGMEVANACMYDGATSLAEACLMAKRLKRNKRKILMPNNVHPEYRDVCKTYLEAQDVDLVSVDYDKEVGTIDIKDLKEKADKETLAVVVQYPNFFGSIEDLDAVRSISKDNDALMISVVTEPLSLAMLKSPGAYGADIVVGEAQSFGNAPSYGGPHVGFFATQKQFVRAIPGRIVGETEDSKGTRSYCLTLSTREQHIRREKATSNICTNEALLATRSTIYLTTLGEQGLKKLAKWNHTLACGLLDRLKGKAKIKFKAPFFNEFVVEPKKPIHDVESALMKKKIIPGLKLNQFYPELKNTLLVCTTELNSEEQIDKLAEAL